MKKKTTVIVFIDGENISHKKAAEINVLTARLGSVAARKVYHRQKDPVTRPWTEKARHHAYRDICLAGAPEKNKVDKKIIKDARRSLKAPDMDWENAQFIILYENFRIYFVNFGYKAKILTFFSIYSILQAKRTRKNCVFGGCIGKMAETPPLWCVRHARLYGNLAQGF